jgi:hypothetical protein
MLSLPMLLRPLLLLRAKVRKVRTFACSKARGRKAKGLRQRSFGGKADFSERKSICCGICGMGKSSKSLRTNFAVPVKPAHKLLLLLTAAKSVRPKELTDYGKGANSASILADCGGTGEK